jgi:membrane protein DedA with SNARE-associated domain
LPFLFLDDIFKETFKINQMGFIDYFLQLFGQMGYNGVILLMAIESSFIPFPSEVVIPPAAYLASQGEMNIWLVILSGVVGSLIGAIFNYIVALYLGRALVHKLADHRFSKFLMIDSRKVQKAEDYFLKYGNMSTLIGRLVPVVRQLISLPAGFSKMNFGSFVFYTTIGAGIWTCILAALGYFFGANRELLASFYHEITYAGIVLGIGFVIFLFLRRNGKKKGE